MFVIDQSSCSKSKRKINSFLNHVNSSANRGLLEVRRSSLTVLENILMLFTSTVDSG